MMKKFFFPAAIFVWMLTEMLTAGGVDLRVSSTRVAPGQSVRVKIVAEGNDVTFPTLEKIGPYRVERLRRSSKLETRYTNGTFSSSTQKILSFEFYPDKTVTIPSLRVVVDGMEQKTRPVTVEVVKNAAKAEGAGGFTLRMYADKKEVYVGEPLIVTVDAAEPLNGAIVQMRYTPPEFKGFIVKPLGGENRIRQGNVTIHRLRYLVTPEQAGTLKIVPAEVKVGVRDLNAPSDPFGIFGSPVHWISLRSNPLHLRVKALPGAADLIGHYSLKAAVDTKEVKANQPVNYTLEIVGEGSLEELADPKFDIPGVTVYGDDAKVNTSFKDGKIYSRYTKKYVFISDRDFEIPALKMREFDYQTGRTRVLNAPAFLIRVRGGGGAASAAAPRKKMKSQPLVSTGNRAGAGAAAGSARTSENLLEDPAYYARKAYEEKAAKLPWYLAGAFGAGMVLMFLAIRLWPRKKRGAIFGVPKGRHYSLEEALRILYPHTNDDPEVEKVVRYLYRVKNGEKRVAIDREALDRLAARYDRENGM